MEGGIRHDHVHHRYPAKLGPPDGGRRERKAAELESRTRLAGEQLAGFSTRPGAQVLQDLSATPGGLTHAEAALRRERTAPTSSPTSAPRPALVGPARGGVLEPLHRRPGLPGAVMRWQDPADPGVVILSVMVGISGLLRFWQEFRSGRAAGALKELVTTTCAVQRRAAAARARPPSRCAWTRWSRATW
ncbi:hypothetical protein [Streptomyces katrae]|uniref:hypothetical protein n=1 Tax=Streptomyces katrae TaxID=68223 RepID=UPI0004C157EB|nr:hypothetical protein [Streptomyces katrae]